MRRLTVLAAPAFALALSGCATMLAPAAPLAAPPEIAGATHATIHDGAGRAIGLLTLAEGPRGVLVRINLFADALPPGWHGLHFHETGTCEGQGFTSSGAHVGHAARTEHGLLNPDGPEPGDLPNLLAAQGAPTAVELYSSSVTLTGARGRADLKDGDGAALVIHAAPDDHQSQPIGNAGARIACAVIPPRPPAQAS